MRNRQVKVSIGRQVIGYVAGETAAYVEIIPISVVPYDTARSATRRPEHRATAPRWLIWLFGRRTHPEALILDEDDEFVFVGFKVPKQWLTQNFRFLQALASVRNMTVRRGL